jgi:hypothetical protein
MGVLREKRKLHKTQTEEQQLRFADLLENLKSESGNCELMKSRIFFIKKERERARERVYVN